MSIEKFDDVCKGCYPVLVDPHTMKVLPDDHPQMINVMLVWSKLTREERQAFHRFACLNSREPADLEIVETIALRLEQLGQLN